MEAEMADAPIHSAEHPVFAQWGPCVCRKCYPAGFCVVPSDIHSSGAAVVPLENNSMANYVTRLRLMGEVGAFNRRHRIGAEFFYYSHPHAEPRRVSTRTEAYILSGHTPVVMVNGVGGCVALSALTPVEESSPLSVQRSPNEVKE
jgi:hypothetical protein